MPGLTATGFEVLTLQQVRTELEAAMRAAFGASINLTPQSVLGQLVGVFAEREALLWEALEATYHARTAEGATGAALDALAAITGTTRDAARASTVTLRLGGTAGTVVPEGSVASAPSTGTRWRTLADATIATGGTVDVEAEATETGPKAAGTGTITAIETPVAGWATVTNMADATLGADVESDAALRQKRLRELQGAGGGALNAIRAGLLRDVEGVTDVWAFENVTDATNALGLPPKSFEVVVEGGDTEAVRSRLWALKPAGIRSHGNTAGTVTDSSGVAQSLPFSRPDDINVWVAVSVEVDEDFPADGAQRIADALGEADASISLGEPLYRTFLYGYVYGVPGVRRVTDLLLGFSDGSYFAEDVFPTYRERVRLDASRVNISVY